MVVELMKEILLKEQIVLLNFRINNCFCFFWLLISARLLEIADNFNCFFICWTIRNNIAKNKRNKIKDTSMSKRNVEDFRFKLLPCRWKKETSYYTSFQSKFCWLFKKMQNCCHAVVCYRVALNQRKSGRKYKVTKCINTEQKQNAHLNNIFVQFL